MKKILLFVALLYINSIVYAQKVVEPSTSDHPDWSKPYPPFQIAGNLYYVGTYDLACYLIVTSQGNILINTGLASSAPVIKANIEKLGFKFDNIKILLTTQAHFDHVGAMAAIKRMTGAQLMINEGDAGVMADGGRSDYAMGAKVCVFEPVKTYTILHNNNIIRLGSTQLTLLNHPGHTKGSCSFLFDVKDKTRSYRVLIANLPTIITDKKFTDIPAYPHIAQDYAYTLKAMKALKFDIWLASHASQFDLANKHNPGGKYNPAAFMDRKGYDTQLDQLQKEFDRKMAQK